MKTFGNIVKALKVYKTIKQTKYLKHYNYLIEKQIKTMLNQTNNNCLYKLQTFMKLSYVNIWF